MSNKYNHGDKVPTEVLINRLNELADAVAKGEVGIKHEFDMRIPAELDRDADCVLSESANRLNELEECIKYFVDRVESGTIRSKVTYEKFKDALR